MEEKKLQPGVNKTDLTTCDPGQVWDKKKHKCLERHSGVLPDSDLTEYAYALAKADRYQEAIDVLDMLDNSNTPRALNYRGYATRKLGRTEEGIGYYLKSVALDPNYPQVREYLGEAYVIQGKFELAKDQLATIEKLCGSKECAYYRGSRRSPRGGARSLSGAASRTAKPDRGARKSINAAQAIGAFDAAARQKGRASAATRSGSSACGQWPL